jgi:hypothetical protein
MELQQTTFDLAAVVRDDMSGIAVDHLSLNSFAMDGPEEIHEIPYLYRIDDTLSEQWPETTSG